MRSSTRRKVGDSPTEAAAIIMFLFFNFGCFCFVGHRTPQTCVIFRDFWMNIMLNLYIMLECKTLMFMFIASANYSDWIFY